MQLRSHGMRLSHIHTYVFEILLCRFEIFSYPWISLNRRSSNVGISMRLWLAYSPAFVGSVIVPALRPYRHSEEGSHAPNEYTPCFSASFPPSRLSRFPSLFQVCRAEYLITLRTSSRCSFRAKSRARGIKDVLITDGFRINEARKMMKLGLVFFSLV